MELSDDVFPHVFQYLTQTRDMVKLLYVRHFRERILDYTKNLCNGVNLRAVPQGFDQWVRLLATLRRHQGLSGFRFAVTSHIQPNSVQDIQIIVTNWKMLGITPMM